MVKTVTSGVKTLPSACDVGQHFQALGHRFSLYGPLSRQITYIFHEFLTRNQRQQNLWQDLQSPSASCTSKSLAKRLYILWYKKSMVTTISTRSYFRQTNACSIDSRKHMSKNQQRQREKSLTYCMETVENYTGVFVSSWRSIDSIASLSSILSGLMEIKSLSTVWTRVLTFSYNTIEGRTFSFKVSVYSKWQPRVVAASWLHVS